MATTSELPLWVRAFLKTYQWRVIDPVPWAPLRKPLREARIALVSTAGMVLPDQEAFDNDVKGGDSSFRVIPSDADPATLIDTHRSKSFDHAGINDDQNLGFPIRRLRELAYEGVIGEAAPRHLSYMGSITATGRLQHETAPAGASLLEEDRVDAVLLVPV